MAGSEALNDVDVYRRTVEDATNMLIRAKQKDEDVNHLTQIFYYPSESECGEMKKNLRLMSIDEEFIRKLENGERFIFKGSNKEKIVMCTENETYEVKEGEISNSLVLCPNLLYNSDLAASNTDNRVLKEQMICGVHHSYLELRLTFPKFYKLKSILEEAEYCGPNELDEGKHKGYYFYELLDIIQCSRSELQDHLQEIRAFCLDDKWRAISLNYITEVLSYIISLMEKQNWKEIHAEETRQILSPIVPDYIINHILMFYATQSPESENLYQFKEDIICRCFAELLLKTAEGKFRYNEFVMAWEQCLHPVITADLNHLKGLVLIEREEGQQRVIHLFSESDLPENISERFRLLFKRKEKWTLDEITPYIEKLATKTLNVNSMLTKHARSSNVNGIRLFCAKYAK